MRAISALILEYGTSTSGFCARAPLRIRVRQSAIGSVTVLMKKSGVLRDGLFRPVAKRHPHFTQERFGFLVRLSRGNDCNIKSDVALDFIELDFRENRLVRDSKSVVAVLVKTARRHAAKVANARQRGFDEALEKFVHALSAQRYLRSNRLTFSQFYIGNMNWTFAFGDFAARIILRLAEVLLNDAHAFNHDTLFRLKHCQDPS